MEADVEGLQRDDFLWWGHALDTSEQVVSHVVGNLKNPILLQVDLSHARVLNLIDRFFLFDELLHTTKTYVHACYGLLDGLVRVLETAWVV